MVTQEGIEPAAKTCSKQLPQAVAPLPQILRLQKLTGPDATFLCFRGRACVFCVAAEAAHAGQHPVCGRALQEGDAQREHHRDVRGAAAQRGAGEGSRKPLPSCRHMLYSS